MIPGSHSRLPPSGEGHSASASASHQPALEALHPAGGRAIARRHSLDNGASELQALSHQVAALETQLAKNQAKDDMAVEPGEFSQAVHHHLFAQRRYENAATADLFGHHSWVRMRTHQLRQIVGGALAASQYGLGFVHDKGSGKPSFARLDFSSVFSGSYQRIAPSMNTLQACHLLFDQRYPQSPQKPRVFASGAFTAALVVNRYKQRNPQHGEIVMQEVAPGLHAISCSNRGDLPHLDALLNLVGARPSAYQVMRNLVASRGGIVPPVNDPQVQNHLEVARLARTDPQSILAQLRAVPQSLSSHTLAQSDADMIESLMEILAMPGIDAAHQHNPLVFQGLRGLRFVAESMPALASDSSRFGNAHRALMEEMHIVLSAVRPYSPGAFRQLATRRMQASLSPAGQAKMLPLEACLLSSGMQALTLGLESALGASRGGGLVALTNGDKRSPFYYEAQAHVDSLRKPAADDKTVTPAFYTSLSNSIIPHSSQPDHHWAVSDIVEGIQQQLAARSNPKLPLNVVIDATLEKDGEMQALLGSLEPAIASNQLRLLVCKSHQKFANLGASKVTAGNITLLAANNPANGHFHQHLLSMEANLGWFNNDESQLMTHLTHNGIKHEPLMLQTAIDNGRFVAEHCFHGQDGHARFAGHQPDQPFAMLRGFHDCDQSRWPGLSIFSESSSDIDSDDGSDSSSDLQFSPSMVMNHHFLRMRSSFGFAESTISGVGRQPGYDDAMARLSFGQENKAELIERFWMASREMQLDRAPFTSVEAVELSTELVDAALTPAQQAALGNAPLSEKLRQVARNEAQPISDAQRSHASITELRGTAATAQQGFTLNKIASVLGYMHHLLTQLDKFEEMAISDDYQPLNYLLRGMIGSGMVGVSPTGREQVIGLQCALSHEAMQDSDPQSRRYAVENLLEALTSHISPSLGVYSKPIPDIAWTEQSPAMQDKLMHAIFGRFDTNTQLEYLHQAMVQCQQLHNGLAFTQDCTFYLAGKLKNTTPEETRHHWLATINEAMVRRGIVPAPKPAQPT